MLTNDNWQEALVEELARKFCARCEMRVPLDSDESGHLVDGASYNCYANKPGLREAIRRTLEHVQKDPTALLCGKTLPEVMALIYEDVKRKEAALRQLMEPGK